MLLLQAILLPLYNLSCCYYKLSYCHYNLSCCYYKLSCCYYKLSCCHFKLSSCNYKLLLLLQAVLQLLLLRAATIHHVVPPPVTRADCLTGHSSITTNSNIFLEEGEKHPIYERGLAPAKCCWGYAKCGLQVFLQLTI